MTKKSSKKKYKFGKNKDRQFSKSKRIIAKIPLEMLDKLKEEIFPKYEINSFQEAFDHIFVSGIIYFNREIIEIIEEEIPFYKSRDVQAKLARMGKAEKPEYPDYHVTNFALYPKDSKALNDLVVEKNWAKQWLVEIAFGKLVEEDPTIISLIEKNKKLNVQDRKKQIARLTEDEWVEGLSDIDRKMLLEQLTENYERRKFNSSIQNEIDKLLSEKVKETNEEEEVDRILNEKIARMKRSNWTKVGNLSKPILDEEAEGP